MKKTIIAVISWILVVWICRVFITSLFYKFTGHDDTVHIFSTIGTWMSDTINSGLGQFFTQYGAYAVGTFELITAVILLLPIIPAFSRPKFHCIGGLMASAVMSGAVFFHTATPLGIEVLHQGEPDGGSLFYAAVSILISGIILFLLNRKA